MALFQQQEDPSVEVSQLRSQGLTDNLIMGELTKKGYKPDQIHAALSKIDAGAMPTAPGMPPNGVSNAIPGSSASGDGSPGAGAAGASAADGNIYERIEEIAESMIDEKWDELIGEVKKIVEWKTKIEDAQKKINADVEKLKEDFKTLHQGVLGKMEQYDDRMEEVGTELKAVGKVFKDVVPEFVENVKELQHVTSSLKK